MKLTQVSSDAFKQAFNDAIPPQLISSLISNKLQQFAAALWARSHTIPSRSQNDPLSSIFDEFDTDSDGCLSSKDISKALVSRGIEITT